MSDQLDLGRAVTAPRRRAEEPPPSRALGRAITAPRRRAEEPPPSRALGRAIAAAHNVRAELLRHPAAPRNLAGQCGLAAMLLADTLDAPRTLRLGFYMKSEVHNGRRRRMPRSHAWCQIDDAIVDPTATQFSHYHRAVHVAVKSTGNRYIDDRYIETADGMDAIDIIMIDWRGNKLPEYQCLAKSLRRKCR